jgi:hypothetical protein
MVTTRDSGTKKFIHSVAHPLAQLRYAIARIQRSLVMESPISWDLPPQTLRWLEDRQSKKS